MLNFRTKRLVIRSFCEDDLEGLYTLFSCEEVARYEDFFPMTKNQVQMLLKQWIVKKDHFAVQLNKTGEFIGAVGFWKDENENYSITFDFLPSYAKQGYATEALTRFISYLFQELSMKELFADCEHNNVAACRLLERLGFTLINCLKDQNYKANTVGDINLYWKRNDLSDS